MAQDYKEAVKWYRLSAEKGDSHAQYNLGICHSNGDGVTQDYKEAVKWYRLSAGQDNCDSQFALGIHYQIGTGVDKDNIEALNWFIRALVTHPDKDKVMAKINKLMTNEILMNMLIAKIKLEKEVIGLRDKVEQLETEIAYRPDGPGYIKAKEEFEELAKCTE